MFECRSDHSAIQHVAIPQTKCRFGDSVIGRWLRQVLEKPASFDCLRSRGSTISSTCLSNSHSRRFLAHRVNGSLKPRPEFLSIPSGSYDSCHYRLWTLEPARCRGVSNGKALLDSLNWTWIILCRNTPLRTRLYVSMRRR